MTAIGWVVTIAVSTAHHEAETGPRRLARVIRRAAFRRSRTDSSPFTVGPPKGPAPFSKEDQAQAAEETPAEAMNQRSA
jgi:hypothetical protein